MCSEAPIKILHTYKGYMPDPTGGVAEVIQNLAGDPSALLDQKILVSRTRGASRSYFQQGVPVRAVSSLGEISSMPISLSFPYVALQEMRRADVVVHHAPFPLTDIAIHLSGDAASAAIIVYWHADLVRSSLITSALTPLIRNSLRKADRIVVAHDELIRRSPFLSAFSNKCTVVPFGIDTAFWSALDNAQAQEVAQLKNRMPKLVVAIGRLVPYKGFDVLLDAFRHVEGHLVVIGSGPSEASLTRKMQELDLLDRVTFAGFKSRDEMKILLNAARVFVLPSVSPAEAFGIAQLEAMSAGLPVVNTDLPTAVPHVARNGIEGLTVRAGDSQALAHAIARLLEDGDLANRLGAAARTRARESFGIERYRCAMRQVYVDVCQARGSTASANSAN